MTHPFKYSFTTCFKERVVTEFLEPAVGRKVLEMGCGSAYFSTVLAEKYPKVPFEYVGLDMAEESLETAKAYIDKKGRLVKGSVMGMPFENESFDDVLYLDVIEHVPDDKKSLQEAFRVLKKGGRLIISTPHSDSLLTDTILCEYMHDHGHMANERAGYSETEIRTLLKEAGFTVEKVGYSNVFLSELLITITKLGYRTMKPKYESQADMIQVSDSVLFNLHKKFFYPIGYAIGRAEEILFKKFLKGHCLIVLARK